MRAGRMHISNREAVLGTGFSPYKIHLCLSDIRVNTLSVFFPKTKAAYQTLRRGNSIWFVPDKHSMHSSIIDVRQYYKVCSRGCGMINVIRNLTLKRHVVFSPTFRQRSLTSRCAHPQPCCNVGIPVQTPHSHLQLLSQTLPSYRPS